MRSEEVAALIIVIFGLIFSYWLVSTSIKFENELDKETIQYIKQYPQCASARNPHYCGSLLKQSSK